MIARLIQGYAKQIVFNECTTNVLPDISFSLLKDMLQNLLSALAPDIDFDPPWFYLSNEKDIQTCAEYIAVIKQTHFKTAHEFADVRLLNDTLLRHQLWSIHVDQQGHRASWSDVGVGSYFEGVCPED